MKRNYFLSSLLLMAVAPFKTFSKIPSLFGRPTKGIKIARGEGRIHGHIQTRGRLPGVVDVKVSGSDTEGSFAVFEQTVLAKGASVPLHFHPAQDEMFYVLEGSYRFKVGDELFELQAGDSVFLPRKIPHAWMLLSEKGTTHVLVQPAGELENFFVKMKAIDHVPTPEEVAKISAESGMTVVGPPLKLE
ncbi:cupin domain-containing protein [Rhodocytophaga rosea]|uniref:Cupin domain-containing protein n=1 Tax=Rhodocytophaga rosea TaxID=2704465 RepID=A0A6C0GTK2_9BACT|nr:cupin domain-containing protein [Rhodocytophaga rosea]QHT71495.1 cupin domain-containing protein [Rhodocytophaga rosea]